MSMVARFSVLVIAFFLATRLIAQTNDFPKSVSYNNTPIDALCFNQNDGITSLDACGIQFNHDLTTVDRKKVRNDQRLIGYEFKINNAGPTQGYSFYRYIDKLGDKDIIFTINNGGGTGCFTAIKTLSRKGHAIDIKTYQSGDRCNHGISNLKIHGNEITYSVNITPFDLLTLANDNPHHLRAYDDLVSCAVCCAGKMNSSRPLNSHFGEEKIISIDLTGYSLGEGGYGSERPYQNCFNSLMETYKSKNKMVLTLDELKLFVREFNHKCFTTRA